MKDFFAILLLELKTSTRSLGELIWAVLFFMLIAITFPFLYTSEQFAIKQIVLPILVYGAILAQILISSSMINHAGTEGSNDIKILSNYSSFALYLIDVIVSWLLLALSLTAVLPFISIIYDIDLSHHVLLNISIAISLFIVASYVQFIGQLFNHSVKGLFLLVFMFPFLVPVFIACGFTLQGNTDGLLFLTGYLFTSVAILQLLHKLKT